MPNFDKLPPFHIALIKSLLFLFFFTTPTYAQPQIKIATVDLLRVFDNYWKTKLSNDQLKERGADFDKARVGMIEELNLLKEDYTKLNVSSQDPANSNETRSGDLKKAQEKLIEYERLEQQIIDFNNNVQKTLADQTQRLRKGHLEEIQEVINGKAKELGYDLTIDSSQDILLPRTPTVLY
jgi:outer membrane protein